MTEQPTVDMSGCHRLYKCNEPKLSVSFSQKLARHWTVRRPWT